MAGRLARDGEVVAQMDQRAWVLGEIAHAGAEHLDAAYVAAWRRTSTRRVETSAMTWHCCVLSA